MNQLKTLILSKLSRQHDNIETVSSTLDLKLLSIHDKNNTLHIFCVKTTSNVLSISNTETFAWQEDNYYTDEYRLLTIDKHHETCFYVILVKSTGDQNILLEVKSVTKWYLKETLQNFHEISRQLNDIPSCEILQFEAKEAVFLFDKKIVASFFLSPYNDPQIMSISDISDGNVSYRKVILMKELIFALDSSGTKLYIYSFANNTKLYETELSDHSIKHSDAIPVLDFSINLNMDLIVFVTENQRIYSMLLNLSDMNNAPKSNSFIPRTVTAFTKQLPSVRRVGDSLRKYSISSGYIQRIYLTCNISDLVLEKILLLENKLFFLYQGHEESLVGIHILDTDEPTLCKRLPHNTFFISSAPEEITPPLLLFFENKIGLLQYNVDQNKLVNELMMYPSSSTVETLACFNDWSSIQMDIEVLKSGLNNRKVYTVELYLKTVFDGFNQSWSAPASSKWFEKIQKDCDNWEDILNLVLQNVKINLSENISYQYAEQLLNIVINMVIQIVDIIGGKASHENFFPPSDKNSLLNKFTHLLLEMRKLVREQEKIKTESFLEVKPVVLAHKLKSEASDYWTKWENVLPEDIIQEAILTGTVPLAQSYFCCCLADADPSFHQFEQASENLVLYFLRQGLISEALSILLNMGIDINSELLKIFKSTPEKDIRSLLLTELQERNLLSSSDLELLKFVALIEKLYPCTSFEHARMLLDEKSATSVNEMNCAVPQSEDKLPVGDLVVLNQDNSESGAYCRIILDWVSSWDNDVKSRILAPHFLKNSPVLDFFSKEGTIIEMNPMSLWCYLLENGCLPYLTNWIETWLSSENKSDCSSFFKKRPITGDMINVISERATLYISEILLNKLARHVVFCEEELEDISLFLTRINRSQCDVNDVSIFSTSKASISFPGLMHTLSSLALIDLSAIHGVFCEEELEDISLFLTRINRSQCDVNDVSIFSTSKASISFPDLMHRLVHYSLKNDLLHLLYFLLSSNYKKFSIWPSCSLCSVPVLNLTKAFYLWSLNHKDSHLAYDAAAALAQYIFSLKSTKIADLLLDIPLPLCLSIFLLKSQPLEKTVSEAIANSGMKEQTVKDKFLPYPLLYNILFKSSAESSHPDITVYELLKGNTVFDTTQLFGWQATNTLRSEDSLNEFPHFSLKSLSEQYGLKKQLNYIYYLLQKRPNYAYLKFVQEEVSSGSGLSISRIKTACSDVADFAIENYRNPEVSLSCILFTELAGKDSLPLRACLVAANILHENMTGNLSAEQDFEKSFPEIRRMFKQAVLSKDAAFSLVTELERIVIKSWDPYYAGSDSLVKDICLWMPVMILSRLYSIEIGSLYLNECAKQNKWLKFLVFAQIFQLSKDQVLRSASKFSNSCIYYHVFHAIQKKSFIQKVSSEETKKAIASKTSKKDMRKSLYTRIGVLKNASGDAKLSPELDDDQLSVSSIETITSSSSSEADSGSFILKDLFSQLLLANSSDVPWESLLHTSFAIQNPVLAILAASYPESPLQSCFYTWLYTALCHDEDCKKYIESHFHCRVSAISTDDIENIILFSIQKKKILLLWQGVQFYIPTTPLMPLMEFLKDFLAFKKFDSSLETFQNQLWDYPKSSDHPSVIHSALWIENVSVSMLKECVITCSTNYERLILLRHFSHTRIEKSFSKEVIVPPFMKVCLMLQYTGDIEENIDVQMLFLPENDVNYKNTCWMTVKKLLQLHLFHEAEMFATAARLPLDDLFLLQMNQAVSEARKNVNWSSLSHRISFWKPILDKLNSTIIPIQAAVEFLENQCAVSDMYGEKYFLMKFIVNLLSMPFSRAEMPENRSYNIEALQRKMWSWCVKAQVKNEISAEIFDDVSAHEFDFEVESFPIYNTTCVFENNEEKEALQYLINQLLAKKDFKKAFELSSVFGYKSRDLEVIYTCLKLAKGEMDASSVDLSIPDCSTEVSSSRFIRSLNLWLTSSSAAIAPQQKDVMMCIEALGRKCETAISICHQILVDFVVATILKKSYVDIVKEKDTLCTLKQILLKRLNDEHVLAKCFIVVHDLPDRDVAIFLSEEIWTSLQCFVISELVLLPEGQLTSSQDIIYDPSSSKESFQLIVKLCQDPSVLGKILMDAFARETTELSSKSSDKTFSCVVELCICAHECFTAACNMEGISQILHNSQLLINLLEEAKKFLIMVRLLIGLGRYSEMVYVFNILKSHDKFSLLFVSKLENAPNLRLALLDYLKRLPPSESDNYFYTLTETFGMYREKAEILEMSVQRKLSQLCKKTLDIDMKEDLENAMQDLAEAAKSYCKADCLYQAQNCTRLAQLIALQIYFLIDSGIWIIGLDEASVSRFITEHDNFSQTFIVAEYYGNHQLWSQAILNNAVIRGDREYLQNFRAQFGLSATLVSDVVKRYQKLTIKLENSTKHIRLLLNLCPNIKVKYSLALELGFSDMASELLMSEGAPYLQDLIENKVIKTS